MLLIAPEGIEIRKDKTKHGTITELLIAPEGIEILKTALNTLTGDTLNRTRRN